MLKQIQHDKKGFTLLELSMVLTMIALLISAILVGKSLIRSAQVRSVMTEEARYAEAITNFRDKFMALPGDFTGATALWGSVPGGCPSSTNAGTGTQTCDGNGNGQTDTYPEGLRAWQHLANAGFIDGTYTGIQSNGNYGSLSAGVNIPASALPGCGWMVGSISPATQTAGSWVFTVRGGTYLVIVGGGEDLEYPACLTGAEAQSIDAKLDDGMNGTGNVIDMGTLLFARFGLSEPWLANGGSMFPTEKCWASGNPNAYYTTSSNIYCNLAFYVSP